MLTATETTRLYSTCVDKASHHKKQSCKTAMQVSLKRSRLNMWLVFIAKFSRNFKLWHHNPPSLVRPEPSIVWRALGKTRIILRQYFVNIRYITGKQYKGQFIRTNIENTHWYCLDKIIFDNQVNIKKSKNFLMNYWESMLSLREYYWSPRGFCDIVTNLLLVVLSPKTFIAWPIALIVL